MASCCGLNEKAACVKPERPSCVDCKTLGCAHNNGRYPSFCETKTMSDDEISTLRSDYEADAETYEFMKATAKTTARGFAEQLCRAEETMDYAHRMG